MFKKIILTAALVGAVSAPALAHDYVSKVNEIRQSLEAQHKRLANVACNVGKQDLCAAANSVLLASKLIALIPADVSNHELSERLDLVAEALISPLDEYALKGQFEGLSDTDSDEASKALTEVQHDDGGLFTIMGEIMKSEGK